MSRIASFVLCLLLTAGGAVHSAAAQPQPHVFRGATLYPIAQAPIENGVLVVQDGVIQAIGAEGTVDVPSGAVEHDATGRVIMPGLVDTHSHVGRVEGGDGAGPLHPGVRSLDAVDVRHSSINRARAGGITTVNVLPGSGHLMSGQTTHLKLRNGDIINDLLLCDNPLTDICGGMKMANGTNPQDDDRAFPGTRARSAALARELFVEAQAYRQKMEQAADDPDEMPERDLGMEALVEVLDGERTVHFHTHRHDDILTVLRLKEEFGFNVVLHHVSEAWKVADEIAAADVPSSIIVLDSPGGKQEAVDIRFENGAVLEEAGADVAYHTDDLITDSRLFLRSAAFGVRAGMSREAALEAMTLAGARMLSLDNRIGSLEEGKDADFIVLSGDPLSVYTHVEQTWVEGEKVFDRADPDDRPYATGGYGVYDDPGALHDHHGPSRQ
jgi:imidazolonepropionase-like amidohydrolase